MATIGKADIYATLSRVNLNHLHYFWAVAQCGSVTEAAKRLGVSQPSVSEQVRTLEHRLGATLLRRVPRGVTLTRRGEIAMRYAEEVVGLCGDLVRSIALPVGDASVRPLIVGTADTIPKVIVRTLLGPLIQQQHITTLTCREWRVDLLLAELSLHRLDLVIADAPIDDTRPGLVCVLACTSKVDLYAVPSLARVCRGRAPKALSGVPMLLPAPGSALRATLERWFVLHHVKPRIVVEAEDRALLHHFAESGAGAVPVASTTARDVARQFGLVRVAPLRGVEERYYVIAKKREHPHPGVAALLTAIADGPRSRRGRTKSRLYRSWK